MSVLIQTLVSPRRSRHKLLLVGAALVLIAIFFLLWRGRMPFEGLMRFFASIDHWKQAPSAADPYTLRKYYSRSVGIALMIAGLLLASGALWASRTQRTRDLVFRAVFTLACSSAIMMFMMRMQFVGDRFPPPQVLMTNPQSLPVFGHRLLFVWIADAFQRIVPSLSPFRAYDLSQGIAVLLAMYALGRWSALQVGETLQWTGQVLGVVMISACFTYRNFYDVGNMFFITCGLIAIYKRKYWWLLPVVMIGTLNYEGVLLLIPVAAFCAYFEDPPKRWVPPLAVALVFYCAIRVILQLALPMPRQVDWRIWSNFTKTFLWWRTDTVFVILALTGWYVIAGMSLRDCEVRMRRFFLLFPLVFAVTFMFGQFTEARQFDAFIPVLVAGILSATRRKLLASQLGQSAAISPAVVVSMPKVDADRAYRELASEHQSRRQKTLGKPA